jgi:hypothetical protein
VLVSAGQALEKSLDSTVGHDTIGVDRSDNQEY